MHRTTAGDSSPDAEPRFALGRGRGCAAAKPVGSWPVFTCVTRLTAITNYAADMPYGPPDLRGLRPVFQSRHGCTAGLNSPARTASHAAAYNLDWTDYGPRIGVAYALDPKTVIRCGWGAHVLLRWKAAMPAARVANTPYISSLTTLIQPLLSKVAAFLERL